MRTKNICSIRFCENIKLSRHTSASSAAHQYAAAHSLGNTALNAEIDRLIAECHLVDRIWFCIGLTRYLKITFFKQYSRKYIKIIHQLVSHVYSLVPTAVADNRLARQIIRWQSWFRRNRHFAFCMCIKGDAALYLHMWYSTLACDIVFVALLLTSRARVIKTFSSWSQSKTSWPPMKQTILAYTTHTYAIQHNKQSSIAAI